jgi:hypothetical protein
MPTILDGSTQLSPTRVRLAILALAVGAFGIGTTEFVAMGLLPNIATDLLPEAHAHPSFRRVALTVAGFVATAGVAYAASR